MASISGKYTADWRKIIVNVSYGDFGFTDDFVKYAEAVLGRSIATDSPEVRVDQSLIAIFEEFAKEASGSYADIIIKWIPPFRNWEIYNYDGYETLRVVFPWKELAIAMILDDDDSHLLAKYREGDLLAVDYDSKSVVVDEAGEKE